MRLLRQIYLFVVIQTGIRILPVVVAFGGKIRPQRHQRLLENTFYMASSRQGMGMAASPQRNKKDKTANGMGKPANGMGKPAKNGKAKSPPFDVSASLIRLEKRYDELILAMNKRYDLEDDDDDDDDDSSIVTSEYVVAVRVEKREGEERSGVSDWVPVAQLCIARPHSEYHDGVKDPAVQAAISCHCRELSHVATLGAKVFATCARNEIQYGVEPLESFHKHVYEAVVEGGSSKGNPNEILTKSQAREILGLNEGADKSDAKQAYRKLSFQLHPDRFEGSEEECKDAAMQFARVKLAYDTLNSGIREEGSSWYESLGGRYRTGFVGPVNLLPLAAADEYLQKKKISSAIVGMNRDLVQSFVARNLGSL